MLSDAILLVATSDAERWREPLESAMQATGITTEPRIAMFLAQCAHESSGFTRLVENLKYSAAGLLRTWPARFSALEAGAFAFKEQLIAERVYGSRMGNGPEGSGDGYRYRGRGIIQLTGRANYRDCGRAIALDLEGSPELLETPDDAALASAWFWSAHGCNELADAGDFAAITKRINGGMAGYDDRLEWLAKVRAT